MTNSTRNPNSPILTGIKMLIMVGSLAGTIGGWAILAITQIANAQTNNFQPDPASNSQPPSQPAIVQPTRVAPQTNTNPNTNTTQTKPSTSQSNVAPTPNTQVRPQQPSQNNQLTTPRFNGRTRSSR
jgi:hypothetical protein